MSKRKHAAAPIRRPAAIRRRAARLTLRKMEQLLDAVPQPTHIVVHPKHAERLRRLQRRSKKAAAVKVVTDIKAAAAPAPKLYALDDAIGALPQAMNSARRALGLLTGALHWATRDAGNAVQFDEASRTPGALRLRFAANPREATYHAEQLSGALETVSEVLDHLEDVANDLARGPVQEKTNASA